MNQTTDAFVQGIFSVGPFGGIDNTTDPYFVEDNRAVDSTNLSSDRTYGSYVTSGGRMDSGVTGLPGPPIAIGKGTDGFGDIFFYLVNGGIWYARPNTAATQLALPAGAILQGSGKFINARLWVFLATSAPNDTPLKIRVDNLAVTNWGIQPPLVAPTAVAGAAGLLNFPGYQYLLTYGVQVLGVTNQESSPGPACAAFAATNQQVTVGLTVSADPQVNERNIYRLDSGGTYRLVGTVSDNTTLNFVDNTPDTLVAGQSLITHRDPPKPFMAMDFHQDAIWGFGWNVPGSPFTQSDLLWSNSTEPWGFDTTNQFLPVGENANGDVAMGVSSTGNVLLLLKTHTGWAVFGDSTNDYFVQKLFDIGCCAPLSVAKLQGVTFWLAGVQGVWAFDGSAPQFLSKDITAFLKANRASLSSAVGFTRDRSYYLSFPALGVTWQYDTNLQQWWKHAMTMTACYYDPDDTSVSPGLVLGSGTTSSVARWFASETDLGLPLIANFTSKISDMGAPEQIKQFRNAIVVAPLQPAVANLTVTIDPGAAQKTFTKALDLSIGPVTKVVSLPGNLKGREVQISLATTSSVKTAIQRVSVYGYGIRRLRQALMALKQNPATTVARVVTSYTVGDPEFTPPRSTIATSPNIGRASATPELPTLIGSDAQSSTTGIPALPAGGTFAFTILIGFPNIATPIAVGTGDAGTFLVNLVALTHGIPGLALAEVTVTPRAFSPGQTYTRESLQSGVTYTGWGASVSGTLVAVKATSAGTLTARASGVVYDLLS